MSGSRSLTATDGSEYELIETTMAESARGRWFLQEYARRNRTADTEMLLGAIERLEGVVTAEKSVIAEPDRVDRMRVDLMDMASAIARTKVEIAAISAPDADHSRLGVASTALDAIVLATERATSDILGAAEHVQEAAWTLRESGSDTAICDQLDHMATQIYTACSFQDLTAQRTARIIHTLRYLEERLGVMMAIWGDELAHVPPEGGGTDDIVLEELCQSDVDRFIGMEALGDAPVAAKPFPDLPEADDLDGDVMFLEAAADEVAAESPSESHAEAGAVAALMIAADTETAEDPPAGDDIAPTELPAASADISSSENPPASEGLPRSENSFSGENLHLLEDLHLVDDPSEILVFNLAEPEAPAAPAADPVTARPRRKLRRRKTDVATAFAEIDELTPEEKAALFS